MSRIFVCGDTHGKIDMQKVHLWSQKNQDLTKDDILIVLGDWGSVWYSRGHKNYRKDLKEHRNWVRKPFTTIAQLGNHENYNLIEQLPIVEKYNGKFYELTVKDYHQKETIGTILIMMRGEVYNIYGKTFFSMGGAESNDKETRTLGKDYWTQELPTEEEKQYGIDNLKKHSFKVDYVIAHNCPNSIGDKLKLRSTKYGKDVFDTSRMNKKASDPIGTYFDELLKMGLNFKEFHFGHWHADEVIDDKYFCHYNNEPKQIL